MDTVHNKDAALPLSPSRLSCHLLFVILFINGDIINVQIDTHIEMVYHYFRADYCCQTDYSW